MNRNRENRKNLLNQRVIFCTECGVELQNFCFKGKIDNVDAIKKNLAQCKKNGKFKGDFCSKLFIADSNNLDDILSKDDI
jgi:hypothetical protein